MSDASAATVTRQDAATLSPRSMDASSASASADDRWWAPGDSRAFPARISYSNELGDVTVVNLAGPTETRGHPFFTPLGKNGRACISCHQPADGMSLSALSIQERWQLTSGKDPIFAAIDGSDCPSLAQDDPSAHSLMLKRGLFRIARPWPPRDADGTPIEPEFKLEIVRDPTGCNRDPVHGLHSATPMVSVYRRPRPATNLKYVTAAGFSFDPKSGLPMPFDPLTGQQTSGNLMSDLRATTLEAQARDALRTHIEQEGDPDPQQLARIVEFEQQLFSAQTRHRTAGSLTDDVLGGPTALADAPAGVLQSAMMPIWSEFAGWRDGGVTPVDDPPRTAFRASVARGAELFSKRTFLVSSSAGITDIGFGDPVRNSCAFCHNMQHSGMDVAPGQVDIGTANEPFAHDANERLIDDVPLFRLTCRADARPHPHLGAVVLTHDPGYALTTGKCIDIGKITAQQMRGLAARAPYFSQGNAKTLRELVEFYDRRYTIDLKDQEKDDLVHFLEVL